MNMKRIHHLALAAAVIIAASGCQKNPASPLPAGDTKIDIMTSIVRANTISAGTKAPEMNDDGSGNFSHGDMITLHVMSGSGKTTITQYGIGVTSLYWKDINLNPEDHKVNFSACYPTQELNDGKFSFNMETAPEKDILWAHKEGVSTGTDAPVELQFKHIMHRLVVNYSVESDIDADMIRTICTAKSACEIDLTGQTADSAGAAEADFTATGKQVSFLLVPQKVSDATLHVTAGQMAKEFKLDEYVKFDNLESGMQLTVNLKIKDGSISLEGSTIDPWGDQGTVEGEIIM